MYFILLLKCETGNHVKQDSAPLHSAHATAELLRRETLDFIAPKLWECLARPDQTLNLFTTEYGQCCRIGSFDTTDWAKCRRVKVTSDWQLVKQPTDSHWMMKRLISGELCWGRVITHALSLTRQRQTHLMFEWMNEKIYIARLKAYKFMLNLPRLTEN